MDPFILAHVSHWAVSLLYVAPVVMVVVFLTIQTRRERRAALLDDDRND